MRQTLAFASFTTKATVTMITITTEYSWQHLQLQITRSLLTEL